MAGGTKLVGVLALEGLGGLLPEPAAPAHSSLRAPAPFVRVAGVELVTRQIYSLVQGGAEQVLVVPGRHRAALEALITKDSRLQSVPVELRDGSLEGLLAELGDTRVLVAGPEVFFGPGVARFAKAAVGPATVLVSEVPLVVGRAMAIAADLTPSFPRDAPPTDRDAYIGTLRSPADVRVAKRHIFRNVTKQTSGWVSKNINALFSIPVSYAISDLPITPNMITIATTVVGLASAVFVAFGDPVNVAIAGVLFQLAAAMDRVDGEIARSKFQASKHGAWIDTVGDNLTYICFVIGLTWGLYRVTGQGWVLGVGGGLLVTLGLMLTTMYAYLRKYTDSGSLVAVTSDMEARLGNEKKPLVYRMLDKIRFAGKRDFFSLAACVVCVLGRIDIAFYCSIAVVVGTIAYFASAARKAFRAKGTSPAETAAEVVAEPATAPRPVEETISL